MRAIVNNSYDTKALERIRNFSYVIFSYVDPLKVIAILFEKSGCCDEVFNALNSILKESGVDYTDLLLFERIECTECSQKEPVLLHEQNFSEYPFEEILDEFLSFSDNQEFI